jgi:ABC-2 type transport system permease protein
VSHDTTGQARDAGRPATTSPAGLAGPGGGPPRPSFTGALRSLSRAMFSGFVRDRSALIFTILIPVLFLVLFGSIYKSSSAPRITVLEVGKVQLLDQARAAAPKQLGKVLTIKHAASLSAALAEVRKGNEDAAVTEQGGTLVVHYSIADQTTAGVVQAVFSSIVQQADEAQAGASGGAFRLQAQQVEDKSLKPIQYLAPGLLGWAIASGGAFGAAITLVTWRKDKLLRRLRLAPVSTGAIVLARVGVSVAVALVQLVVFLAIATTPYFGLKLTASWWMGIPVVVAGTLAFMSIGLLVGSFAKTQQAATSIANLIILPMAFLGGAFIPLDYAPAWIRDVSYVMPLRYLVTGMQNVMARGEGPAAALPALGILLGLAVVLTLISVRVFRWDDV